LFPRVSTSFYVIQPSLCLYRPFFRMQNPTVQYYYVPASEVALGEGQPAATYIAMQAFPTHETPAPMESEKSPCESSSKENDKKCSKNRHRKNRSLRELRSVCVGCGVCFSALLILGIFLLAIVSIQVGNAFHSCFDPPYKYHESWRLDPNKIKSISVELTAGNVEVFSCPYAKNISISLTVASREKARLQKTMNALQVDETAGSVQLSSQFDSFDLHHCTAATVKIVVPTFIHDVALHVSVDTGKIKFDTQEFASTTVSVANRPRLWSSVNFGLHTGLISVGRLAAQQFVNIDTKLGVVQVSRLEAPLINVTTTTGAVHLSSVFASDLRVVSESGAVDVDFLALSGLGKDTASIICEWGVVSLKRFVAVSPTAKINISSQSSPIYATLHNDNISGAAFVLQSVSGTIEIVEKDNGKAKLITDAGNFKVGRTSEKDNLPSFVAMSHSGPIHLTVRGIPGRNESN
jgi:hypothetical protein